MIKRLIALFAGALFGAGLLVSGMTQPAKVIGFLDFSGSWDPSLMGVMAGAIGIHFILSALIRKRARPMLASSFHLPTRSDIDPRLVGGSLVFGIGWGIAGMCPGPGIVTAASGLSGLVFLGGMLAGVALDAFVLPALTLGATATEQASL